MELLGTRSGALPETSGRSGLRLSTLDGSKALNFLRLRLLVWARKARGEAGDSAVHEDIRAEAACLSV